MSQLIPFQFDTHNVRVRVDDAGEPWWVVADVCEVLGLTNASEVVKRIDDNALRKTEVVDTYGQSQLAWSVSEPGLYELIFRSNKPDAKRFRQWVFTDVLPQIRKTGKYDVAPAPPTMVFPPELTQAITVMAHSVNALIANNVGLQAAMVAQEQAVGALETRVTVLESQQSRGTGYMTLLAYARVKGFHLALSEARRHGQELRKRAYAAKVKLGEAPDERWGKVNTYPIELLDEYFGVVIDAEHLLE